MSTLLEIELARLDLQPGKPFRTTVNGHKIEVRLVDEPKATEPAEEPSQFADQVMLQPWFTIPRPPGIVATASQVSVEPMLPRPYNFDESDLAPE